MLTRGSELRNTAFAKICTLSARPNLLRCVSYECELAHKTCTVIILLCRLWGL